MATANCGPSYSTSLARAGGKSMDNDFVGFQLSQGTSSSCSSDCRTNCDRADPPDTNTWVTFKSCCVSKKLTEAWISLAIRPIDRCSLTCTSSVTPDLVSSLPDESPAPILESASLIFCAPMLTT